MIHRDIYQKIYLIPLDLYPLLNNILVILHYIYPMLRIIFTKNPILRDILVNSLALSRNMTEVSESFQVYQK